MTLTVQESEDYKEGQRSFAEKRKPVFKGQIEKHYQIKQIDYGLNQGLLFFPQLEQVELVITAFRMISYLPPSPSLVFFRLSG